MHGQGRGRERESCVIPQVVEEGSKEEKGKKGMNKKEGRRNECRKSEESVRGYKHFFILLFFSFQRVTSAPLIPFLLFCTYFSNKRANDTMSSDTHSTTLTTNNADTVDTHNHLTPEAITTTELTQQEGRVTNEILATVGPVATELAQEFSIDSLSAPAVKEAQGQIQTVALQMDGIRTQVGQVPHIRLCSLIPGLHCSTARNLTGSR